MIVRAKIDPPSLAPSLRSVFHEIDPGLPFRQAETMRNVFDDVLALERLENWLFATFAALALLLGVIGLCGLIAHEVELGTRDIGVLHPSKDAGAIVVLSATLFFTGTLAALIPARCSAKADPMVALRYE